MLCQAELEIKLLRLLRPGLLQLDVWHEMGEAGPSGSASAQALSTEAVQGLFDEGIRCLQACTVAAAVW